MPKRLPLATPEAAYDEAVRMLTRKARSIAEVAAGLREREADDRAIAGAIDRLVEEHILDDEKFATDEATALVDQKGFAPAAAVRTLVERGLAEALAKSAVDAAKDGRGELELCAQALRRHTRGARLDQAQAGKEARALARLGYDEEVVARVIEKAEAAE